MADDNTIIEGTVKFRDGKKWKSRWCVMRRLSPVADCVHLQLYRDSKARWSGASSKASLSLQHYLGCESGFTLDKHSNTFALVCRDFVAVLAFETRERLIQWQVKVCAQLGSARQYMVLVAGGSGVRGLRAGPARLLLLGQRAALTAGVPPRLLGLWEMPHLRRYGVVEGRFCFEGGSLCGKGEGLHVLITDQAKDLAHDFDLASQGRLSPNRRPFNMKKNDETSSPTSQKAYRTNTKLSELKTIDQSLPPVDFRLYEDPSIGEEATAISPYWPSTERIHIQDMGLGDTASVTETTEGIDTGPWSGGNVTLERCMSCMSKLGALSRSSTVALTPGAKHFNPAWTMESVQESASKNSYTSDTVPQTDNPDKLDRCSDRPPDRPPKPTSLDLNLNKKPATSVLVQTCDCSRSTRFETASKLGPYENYDVPKLPSADIEGEYYDTPKRLKECLNSDLFQMTKSTTSNAVILKKPCGCLLKFGKRRKNSTPTIVNSEETIRPTGCPCRRVTDWANNWIKLPYCRRSAASTDNLMRNKENLTPDSRMGSALYATIDLSRKTKRKVQLDGERAGVECAADIHASANIDPRAAMIDEGPLANYENLNFALSLEHYENAKDLLLSAGVTREELDAIRDNLKLCGVSSRATPSCRDCGASAVRAPRAPSADDYLAMEPNTMETNKLEPSKMPPAGYTPMSPLSGFALQVRHLAAARPLDEKSASNPALGAPPESSLSNGRQLRERRPRTDHRKRSSSADSSRFLEGGDESEGEHSSAETLRGVAVGGNRVTDDCGCVPDKHSDADSSEASKGCAGARLPGNRDSSSSNDSGVSSWSARGSAVHRECELPATTCAARRHYRRARRVAAPAPRRARSAPRPAPRPDAPGPKCSSAGAEVPVLPARPLRGVLDTHSTSSGTSDMSDYIETLSICSSHSSTDTPITMRVVRQTTSTLRPRSGNEYQNVDARLTLAPHAPLDPLAAHAPLAPHTSALFPSRH